MGTPAGFGTSQVFFSLKISFKLRHTILDAIKSRARLLKSEIYTLYLAYRDPRAFCYARAWASVVVGYAFSPIDLIPDFIPLLV